MGAKKKAAVAAGAAKAAKDNAYLKAIVEDDDLRDNIRQAYESARDAYARMSNGKSPAKAIFDDKKLHKDLRQAADSLRDATVALREAPNQGRSGGGGLFRKVLLVAVAGGLALALSEGLRKKVLDALFGAEEEFEYTAGTTGDATTASSGDSPGATSKSGSSESASSASTGS